jgi:hypothetical protein
LASGSGSGRLGRLLLGTWSPLDLVGSGLHELLHGDLQIAGRSPLRALVDLDLTPRHPGDDLIQAVEEADGVNLKTLWFRGDIDTQHDLRGLALLVRGKVLDAALHQVHRLLLRFEAIRTHRLQF